ncbi:hypothetical protein DXH95_07870 [Sphingorhabdus pulchriflava]|uniref:DUF1176 domain-containing protein n=1 Tax=Sphingorhabdus pulchriflava TaxID=2292257 RepID=A0A371BI71_9SPHN|nr:hypothetical protein [Sphingorhabdus pulchriflava]RDV07270.1 hypothetical protein DXH95_07870 [Sphingorhabdus pulchriflava]
MSSNPWPLKTLLAALLAGCTVLDGPAVDALTLDDDVLIYGQWTVGCSNLRRCTAIVPLSEPSRIDAPYYLQMRYSGMFSDSDGFSVMRDGKVVATLSSEASDWLLQDLRKSDGSDSIRIVENDLRFDVPRSGFAQVIAALEAWRLRSPQTSSNPDIVTPLPAMQLDNPTPPLKVVGAAKRCPKGHMGQSLQAWRGIGGQTLWKAGCGNEGLNSASFWYLAGPQGAPAMEIQFEDRDGPVTLYNSWFEASNGYLHSTYYFGHFESYTEDCGIYRAYVWAVEGMKLVEQREMPKCGTGIGPEGWITTYRAAIIGGASPRL